ncbi:monooxygenase [Salmonella enterica subsp. enterica serovar Choleraesuis]|nr:monooxygenase [Salmonella enterica subsp. enterica serovar Choleraesuis]
MPQLSTGAEFTALTDRFRPIFTAIAAGAVERERQRILPVEAISQLKQAGFAALRVPKDKGGAGLSLPQLSELLIELAAADSNLTQALRAHISFVENVLNQPDSPQRDRWFARFVDGELVGSGWTEPGDVKLGDVNTTVTPQGDGWLLNGEKFYSTGALFADWIDVYARRADTGAHVIALVRNQQPGVTRLDDWDGFGQRLTGSGTTRFENAQVDSGEIYPVEHSFRYQTAFFQQMLLVTLAGIGRAVAQDAAQAVRGRSRVYSHGNSLKSATDPQVLQVVGEIASSAWAVEATVLRAAQTLQRAYEAHLSGDEELINALTIESEAAVAQAQVIATRLIPEAATELFNALGASDTRVSKALDRHWRNARTVSSHNPVIYKARNVGGWLVNGTPLTTLWQVGTGKES